jgi:hypothetical protein
MDFGLAWRGRRAGAGPRGLLRGLSRPGAAGSVADRASGPWWRGVLRRRQGGVLPLGRACNGGALRWPIRSFPRGLLRADGSCRPGGFLRVGGWRTVHLSLAVVPCAPRARHWS